MIMIPNKIVSGTKAKILAYGFSGNKPYHFSSKYLRPWAIRIEKGKMKKTTASGLKPVIRRQKIIRIEAIELREAKNPRVVEKRPIRARAKVGRLTSGDRNTPSRLLCHEKTGANPLAILGKNCWIVNPSAKSSSITVPG